MFAGSRTLERSVQRWLGAVILAAASLVIAVPMVAGPAPGVAVASDTGAPLPGDDAYAIRVPPLADPIADGWQRALDRPPRAVASSEGDDLAPRPWELPNTLPSSSLFEKFPHNPVLPLGKKGSLDSGHAEYPSVVQAGGLYWLFYSAYGAHHRWEIAAAVAADGIGWTKLGVVLAPDQAAAAWDSATIAFPCVTVDPAAPAEERFRMWYAGKQGALYDGIGYATSANGRQWTRRGQVMAVGQRGEWDGSQIVDPCVIAIDGGYRMYYCGSRDADGLFAVGVALSADGRNWVKYPDNPIYDPSTAEKRGVYTVDVVPDAGRFILFASAPTAADEYEIHAVLSTDGFGFDAATHQVVLAPARDSTWDDAMVYGMDVMASGDTFYMWFNGIYDRHVTQGGEVGLARVARGELLRLFDAQPALPESGSSGP